MRRESFQRRYPMFFKGLPDYIIENVSCYNPGSEPDLDDPCFFNYFPVYGALLQQFRQSLTERVKFLNNELLNLDNGEGVCSFQSNVGRFMLSETYPISPDNFIDRTVSFLRIKISRFSSSFLLILQFDPINLPPLTSLYIESNIPQVECDPDHLRISAFNYKQNYENYFAPSKPKTAVCGSNALSYFMKLFNPVTMINTTPSHWGQTYYPDPFYRNRIKYDKVTFNDLEGVQSG